MATKIFDVMRKLKNPWQGANSFHCFGCDKSNPIGLKLDFFEEGDSVICLWKPQPEYQGYIDTLHGGIQSTLHDELASWVIYVIGKTAGMTAKMEVSFLKPVSTNEESIKLLGKIVATDKKHITVHTRLFNDQGDLCSEANVVYRVFPQELAVRKLNYPGPEAFYA